jgi:hypothetical protein
MTKISSSKTWFFKRVFPLIWFGGLAVFLLGGSASGAARKDVMFLVMPVLMAGVGFVVMKKMIWDLLDEVYDGGDFLLVKSGGQEDRILLSNVMNVSASTNTNPPRITLRLLSPSLFGTEIVFSPVTGFTLNPFAKNKVAEDLITRVDQARSRRAI